MHLNWQFSQFTSVQSLSSVWLFASPWTGAHQASLSITSSWSLLKLMSIQLVMPWNHLKSSIPFSSCLQSFPASGSFPMSQFFASGGQSIGVSASASVLPMNIQDWFPLGWTGSSQVNILCLISATYWVLVTFQKSQLKANVKETKQKEDNRRIISPAFSFY